MPFKSKAQQGAAFSGGLGPEMKAKAPQWAAETPDIKNLPQRAAKRKTNRVHHGGKLADLTRG